MFCWLPWRKILKKEEIYEMPYDSDQIRQVKQEENEKSAFKVK